MLFSILLLGVLIYFLNRFRKRRMYELLAKMKMPPGLPFIGNIMMMAGSSYQTFHAINEACSQYGPNFASWMVYFPAIFISKPEDLEIVMQSQNCLSKSFFYDFTKIAVGEGLFSAPVHKWRKTRKIIQPTFNSKILHSFIPIFQTTSSTCIDEILPKFVGKRDVEWYKVFTSTNLDSISQTAMGVDTDAQRKETSLGKYLEQGTSAVFYRMTNILLHFEFIFYFTNLSKQLREAVNFLEEFTFEVLREKKEIFREKQQNKIDEAPLEDFPIKRQVFLDQLLELDQRGVKFSDKDLRDEVISFFIGGTDTSATTTAFFLEMMGMHQNIQDKVYDEIISILGPDRTPNMEDIDHFDLLERCMKETMRLFSPAPYVSRDVREKEVHLSDCILPIGSVLILPIFHVHRNSEYWENPLKFDPDRFLPENVAKRHPYSFLPFSGGLRGCVARKYSYINLKVLLSMILRKYKIFSDHYSSIEEIDLTNNIVIKPVNGFKFYLEERV